MGAMGKSAQFLLHTWLPDAMEGPTPVSALIHAATMVTAGVFMVARLSPLFELAPNAQAVVMFFGATTAFFAATVGLVQNDIKRIVAYSTCSQLGYMFVAMGAGAYSVGMFHLFTHAFFKALLFLGSGSVIYAMHHEQDIRNMGGLKDKIPYTYSVMVIGTLALTGFPLTAGYFSKDAIIESAYVAHNPFAFYGFAMTVIAAGLTSFYSWRLIFKTFHGEPHDQQHYEAAHEAPMWMLIPIGILAAGSILAGFPFKELFAGHGVEEFFRESLKMHPHIIEEMHHIPQAIAFLPTVMMVLGFLVSWLFYIRRPYIPVELANQHQMLYQFLLNKWYFDELYDFIFVRPAKWIGYFALEEGRRLRHRRLRSGRRLGAGARRHPQRGEDPDRLSLSLRLCDADRRRRVDHLVHVRLGRPVMTTWPILSVVTFLPVVGALAIYLTRGDDEAARRNARWIALWTTLVTFAVSLILVWRFDAAERGLPVRRKGELARQRHHLSHGRRRHFAAVRDPDHRPDAVLHHRELEIDHDARARIHDGVPAAGNADGRHLLGARPRAVLSVLRGRPDPDVPDHRRLGRPAPGLRVVQVLPLHAARLGPDAARHHGAVLECRHHRHPDPDAHRRAAVACRPGRGWRSLPRSR